MRYGSLSHPQSGILVPLASLRSSDGLGIGEFPDLTEFARWAASAGFDLVQILPIQDTGDDPSPYAARGAFALHPIHLRLQDIGGAERAMDEIDGALRDLSRAGAIDYSDVLARKMALLHRIFDECDPRQLWDEAADFVTENPWIRVHAVYQMLRRLHGDRPWWEWPDARNADEDLLRRHWDEASSDLLFEVWIQVEADRQLRNATQAIDALGVKLKGDLPILMSRDSSDVWFHRRIFDESGMAGAPPDLYTESGQLWGFPCYRWDAMEDDDHSWWRERLRIASRYFHALRIDHVLGFFRIWRVPAGARTAMLGHFDPSPGIRRSELHEIGIGAELVDRLAGVGLDLPSEESLFDDSLEADEQIDSLRSAWERILLADPADPERFHFAWHAFDTEAFAVLDETVQERLFELAERESDRQEDLWEETGRRRLALLGDATDALICAEDLGATPDCVPRVLHDLGLLGLRLERWIRDWDAQGQPFVPPSAYDPDSVCSPGTHDASSLRAWWEEEDTDRQAYWNAMGKHDAAPATMNAGLLREVLERNLAARSWITILALPDLLALDDELRPDDPRQERINVPGTPSARNWRWRMPLSIEDLALRSGLGDVLREMTDRRRSRPVASL